MILCLCVVSQAQPRKKTSLVSPTTPQCLKILKKVSFNIASEASYVYILNGQMTKRRQIDAKKSPKCRQIDAKKSQISRQIVAKKSPQSR